MTADAGGIMVAAIGKHAEIGGAMARRAKLGKLWRWAVVAVALSATPAVAGEAVLFAAASTRNAVVETAALFARRRPSPNPGFRLQWPPGPPNHSGGARRFISRRQPAMG